MERYQGLYEHETGVFYCHTDHLGSASWITDSHAEPIQYIHYTPFGELIANQRVSNYNERFKFTGKERDEESQYDFFGARYFWSAFTHWLSVDPLSDKYPNISAYAYCSWNPINKIDPDGMDEWEFDIKSGQFSQTGNKGGDITDYYSVGERESGEFNMNNQYEIARDDGTINAFRFVETEESTISAFHIPGKEDNNSGFFLERPGPDTEISGERLRIPEGTYKLRQHFGSNFSNVPRLYRQSERTENSYGKFDTRAILIHVGNKPVNTDGCLLPGSSYGTNTVNNSNVTFKWLNLYIKSNNWNVNLNIINLK